MGHAFGDAQVHSGLTKVSVSSSGKQGFLVTNGSLEAEKAVIQILLSVGTRVTVLVKEKMGMRGGELVLNVFILHSSRGRLALGLKCMYIFLKGFIYLLFVFREGKGGGKGGRKRGRETSMYGYLLCTPTGDLACNPGMCPDWESKWWPFGSQASTQSTEQHHPGHEMYVHFLKGPFLSTSLRQAFFQQHCMKC